YSLLTTEHGALTIARILWAVLAVVAGVLVSRTIRAFLRTEVFPQTRHVDLGTQAAICTLLHYAILALAFYIGLQILFVSLGALTILLGTLGLGLGLGLQPLFVNFISGLMILFERQVKVGDVIELADKTPCEVLSISMRSTQIRTPDNIDHVIPNGEFINGRVVNWTLTDTRLRARMQIGVAYGSDPQLVRKILLDVAHRHPDVLVDPAPEVWFVEFGDNALIFVLAVWFPNAAARWRFLSQVRFELTDLFKQHNIEIPFPQRTLSVIGDKPLPVEIRGPDRPAPQEPKPTAP
ncbi:MAG TPA: mechanosensitive ion channel domain-containing protein, partial [Phycisphaerae bacterium]|nr:mechanosensitive ion channel domain-containing protein [Phycisphaerae bacterium]